MNTTPGAIDWLGQFTQSLTGLTLQNGGALSNFGMLLLTFIATMTLIGAACVCRHGPLTSAATVRSTWMS